MQVVTKFELLRAKRETLYKFRSFEEAKDKFSLDDYDSIYKSTISHEYDHPKKILELLFAIFNVQRPIDFKRHSLSVSDVVILEDKDYYYCDDIGFKKLDIDDLNKKELKK